MCFTLITSEAKKFRLRGSVSLFQASRLTKFVFKLNFKEMSIEKFQSKKMAA